jgi:hypothetical protein
MQRQGCDACHQVESRCDACHGSHHTDRRLAGDALTCATCHMGPDHAQYEMWKTSRHGVVYGQRGGAEAPDCRTCHMPAGTHDVSVGITMGLAGQPYPAEKRAKERGRMLDVCAKCHTRDFAARNLSDGDAIQKESKAIVKEAEAIVLELDALSLLEPAPSDRPSHPFVGKKVELGPQMLYEQLSRPEAIFFEIKKFHYVTAYKGAFHQNPDYAHWYGNSKLKLAVSELRSEAALLKRVRLLEERLSVAGGTAAKAPDALELELSKLRERRVKGEIDQATLEQEQRALLEKAGL